MEGCPSNCLSLTCETDAKLIELNVETVESEFALEDVGAIEAVEAVGPHDALLGDDHRVVGEILRVVEEVSVHFMEFSNRRVHLLILLILAHCVEVEELVPRVV